MNRGKKAAIAYVVVFLAGVVIFMDQAARIDLRDQLAAANCELAPCRALHSTASGLAKQISLDQEYGIVGIRRLEGVHSGPFATSSTVIYQTQRRGKTYREAWDFDRSTATDGKIVPLNGPLTVPSVTSEGEEPKAGIFAPPQN